MKKVCHYSFARPLLIIVITAILLNLFTYRPVFAKELSDEINFLMQFESFLKNYYVSDVDDLNLLRGAIRGMMESLDDPYSEYFTPEEFKEFTENTSGNFGGIGVVITTKGKYVTAVSVIEGSPAEKAGIKAGDRFVEIDGDDITSFSSSEIANRLKGERGSIVKVGIRREGERDILRFEITRDIININPIESKVLGQGIGYLKIAEFNENTVENLDIALEIFKKSGVQGIVLDIRNNPGGLLDQAIEVASRFVQKGPVVSVVSKDGNVQTFSTNHNPHPFKLVVLINGGSASASEVLAGAVKDRKAGVLVGEKTFGKATVQRTLSLGSLGGIKITVAHYITPNGIDINKTGIVPDITVKADRTNPMKDFIEIKDNRRLQYGSFGFDVMGIQQRLRLLGLFTVEPDGVFGPRTRQAVMALQRQQGLKVTGIVDDNFYKTLDEAIHKYLSSREDVQLRKAIDVLKEQLKGKQKAV